MLLIPREFLLGDGGGGPGMGCTPHVLSALTLVSFSFSNQQNKFKVCDIFLEFGALSPMSLTPVVSKDRIGGPLEGAHGLGGSGLRSPPRVL